MGIRTRQGKTRERPVGRRRNVEEWGSEGETHQRVCDSGSTTAGRSRTFRTVGFDDVVAGGTGGLEGACSESSMAGETKGVPERARRREKSAQQETWASFELSGGAGVG